MERLRKDYPKLTVCLEGDALYAAEPIMKICNGNHWKYILTQKDARQKVLAESYRWIREGGGAKNIEKIGKERGD